MAITFACESCGKTYTVSDGLGGKTGQCRVCGHQMLIPSDPDPDPEVDGLEILDSPAPTDSSPTPRLSFGPVPEAKPAPPDLFEPGPPKKGFFSFGGVEKGRGLAILLVLAGIGFRAYFRWDRGQARRRANVPANPAPGPNNGNGNGNGNANGNANNPGPNLHPARAFEADRSGPIALPRFPEVGPGREIEPGILWHEIVLGPPRPPFGTPPGHGGKLWLYLPEGEHADRSLPCVLITAAGSNLQTGNDLGDGGRPEHLPYVRAGFAVLAFELDGVPRDPDNPTQRDLDEAATRFLNARAGLVNAHIALEYALNKVPQVDPSRISVAGHSSAGTLALLFAEHEPRLRACVAYAPAIDLQARFGLAEVRRLRREGLVDLATAYSPRANERKLQVPLFLFHARDDGNVPVADSEACAARLKAQGKDVTLDLVDSGDHYHSMIDEGIPHAITWLKQQNAGPAQ